jgi:Co/Zn/Cd efflux system component
MAHYRKYMAAAAGLNTAISVGEAVGRYLSNSLSLIMDSVHNLSDEMPLWRSGLLLLLWEAVPRFLHPVPVQGLVPVLVGLTAAAANWAVARLLLKPSEHNPAI